MNIKDMKNLGPAAAILLAAAGITTIAQLRATGSIMAYQKVRATGFRASLKMLYALEGALTNTDWSQLPVEVRSRLLVLVDVDVDASAIIKRR